MRGEGALFRKSVSADKLSSALTWLYAPGSPSTNWAHFCWEIGDHALLLIQAAAREEWSPTEYPDTREESLRRAVFIEKLYSA